MADTQGEIRVSDDTTAPTESRDPEHAATENVARMLANPRRVRRD